MKLLPTTYATPSSNCQNSFLRYVSCSTVAAMLQGHRLTPRIRKGWVVDCRFAYEYYGGHIQGAVNFPPRRVDELRRWLNERLDRNTAVVFHCEFSKARAPRICREIMGFMRHLQQNIFVMRSGYSQFHKQYPEWCSSRAPLRDDEYAASSLTLPRRPATREQNRYVPMHDEAYRKILEWEMQRCPLTLEALQKEKSKQTKKCARVQKPKEETRISKDDLKTPLRLPAIPQEESEDERDQLAQPQAPSNLQCDDIIPCSLNALFGDVESISEDCISEEEGVDEDRNGIIHEVDEI